LRVGEGTEPILRAEEYEDYIRIPDDIVFTPLGEPINDSHEKQLIREVYPDTTKVQLSPEILRDSAIFTTLNADVDKLNHLATAMLPGEPPTLFRNQDTIVDSDSTAAVHFAMGHLNALNASGMPPHLLELKVGQPIILLRNINPRKGLCNGTKLIVKRLGRKYIQASILSGKWMGQRVAIPRIPLLSSDDSQTPVKFERRQFPIKPSFAMTINKSEGQTLQSVGVCA